MDEHHFENEVETPGQTQYPGSGIEDTNANGEIDGEDKAKMPVQEGEEEKYYSSQDNPMSRERRAHGVEMPKSSIGKSYSSKTSNLRGHSPAGAMSSIAHDASQRATGKLSHERAATLHTRAATAYGVDSAQRKSHQDAAKKHSDIAAGLKENTEITEGTAQTTHARVQSRYADEASQRANSYGGKNYHLHMIAHHHHANAAAQHERAADTSFDDDVKADHAGGASYHHDAADHHLKAANALKGVKEGVENPTDKLTLDVPAMIRSLEKAREDFKTDEDIHNFVQDLLKKKDSTIDTNALPTNEALDPKADAGTWISDFVHSKDPKFAGKSKEERTKQALAAYYQARRDAGLKEEAGNPLSYVARLAKNKAQRIGNMAHDLGAEAKHKDDHNLHMAAHYLHKHAAEKHFTAGEYHPASSNDRDTHYAAANDHNLRAADHLKAAKSQKESVNEGAPADAKAGPEVMDVATKKAKDDNDKNVKTEEAPYTNKADGSENIVPADKPEAKPSPMPKLTKEETLRSVAETYASMYSLPLAEDATGETLSHNAETASKATSKFNSEKSRHKDPYGAVKAHVDAAAHHAKAAQHFDAQGDTAKADHHWNSHNLHSAEAAGVVDEHPAKSRDSKEFRDAAGELKAHQKNQPTGWRDTNPDKHPTPSWHPMHGAKVHVPSPEKVAAANAAFRKAYGDNYKVGR